MPPDVQKRLRRAVLDRLDVRRSRQHPGRIWMMRLAPAAAFILLAGAVWLLLGGGSGTAAAGFAQVQQRVLAANSIAYEESLRVAGETTYTLSVMMKRPAHIRATGPDGRIYVSRPDRDVQMVLDPRTGKARFVFIGQTSGSSPDPVEELAGVHASDAESDGREKIGNRLTDVYRVRLPDQQLRVFVDRETDLPVRIESRFATADGRPAVRTLDSMAWNVPMANELFSMDVPPGYTLAEPSTESSLIDLLRTAADLGGNALPSQVDMPNLIDLVVRAYPEHVISPSIAGTAVARLEEPARQAVRRIAAGLDFLRDLRASGGEWQYVGAGLGLGDPKVAACWYRPAGASTYRVIYADLHVEDVAAEDMPTSRQPSPESPAAP